MNFVSVKAPMLSGPVKISVNYGQGYGIMRNGLKVVEISMKTTLSWQCKPQH